MGDGFVGAVMRLNTEFAECQLWFPRIHNYRHLLSVLKVALGVSRWRPPLLRLAYPEMARRCFKAWIA